MINKKLFLVILSFLFLSVLIPHNRLYAAKTESTTPEPYEEEEFPQWAKDLRRTEIITIGSMPFVTTWVTVSYGLIGWKLIPEGDKYHLNDFPNPLDKSKNVFNEDQIKFVVATSALISVGLGITDYVINLIKRNNKNKKNTALQAEKGLKTITPLSPEEAGNLIRKNSIPETSEITSEQEELSTVQNSSETVTEVIVEEITENE